MVECVCSVDRTTVQRLVWQVKLITGLLFSVSVHHYSYCKSYGHFEVVVCLWARVRARSCMCVCVCVWGGGGGVCVPFRFLLCLSVFPPPLSLLYPSVVFMRTSFRRQRLEICRTIPKSNGIMRKTELWKCSTHLYYRPYIGVNRSVFC